MISNDKIDAAALELFEAGKTGTAIEPLLGRIKGLTIEDAYKIQLANIERKKKEGERIIGKKIGLTSFPMQKLLGVYEPDYGHVFESMLILNGELPFSKCIQPKAEGEIAFVMKEDIEGPVTPYDIVRATDFVVPAIEIIDSRIRDWKIKIEDTIADNASSAFIITGPRALPLKDVDMFTTGMVFSKNGEVVNTGAAAEVMGNPVIAVSWLVNKLSEFGVGIKKGEVILSGALTAAVAIKEGDVIDVAFNKLGSVSFRVTK
jgi:2-keto-4-pentenoate hydratase